MSDQKQSITDRLRQWIEKRKNKRVTFSSIISMESEDNLYTGVSQDISTGGIFVVTDRLLPLGTKILVEFIIPPNDRKIKICGEVRWLRESNNKSDTDPGMGLQFVDLSEEDRQALESFIELRDPMLYEP